MNAITMILKTRMNASFSLATCVFMAAFCVSTAAAENPLRFIPADESSNANTQVQQQPVEQMTPDEMPPEVYEAIYQDGQNQAKIYYDRAVEPATHETPFQVRQLDGAEMSAREVAVEPVAVQESAVPPDARNDLSLVGVALNSIQPAHTHAPAPVQASARLHAPTQGPDQTPTPREMIDAADQSREDSRVGNQWQLDPNEPDMAVSPQTNEAVVAPPAGSLAPSSGTSPQPASPQFRKIIERIALSTCLVLCGGVGFILVAKQFLAKKTVPRKTVSNSIQIKSQLQLSPKSNLFLVETGKHRMIVASDQNGIQSVVPLTDSFSETLESFANEEVSESSFAAVPSSAKPADEQPDAGKLPPEMYSLATVGQRAERRANVNQPVRESRSGSKAKVSESATPSSAEAEVRRKMENALRDRGLKDLLMQSLQAKAA